MIICMLASRPIFLFEIQHPIMPRYESSIYPSTLKRGLDMIKVAPHYSPIVGFSFLSLSLLKLILVGANYMCELYNNK